MDERRHATPWVWVLVGVSISGVAGAWLALSGASGATAALFVAGMSAGGMVSLVGVVALGVVSGLEHYDRRWGRDPLK